MADYHKLHHKVKLILALLCASIIAAYDPRWLARPVKELIPPDSGVRADWLSHLKKRILPTLIQLVLKAMQRGRPVKELPPTTTHALDDEVQRVRDGYKRRCKAEGKRSAQDWLVETFSRLKKTYDVEKKDFCAAVGVAYRSFRFWSSRKLKPAPPPVVHEPLPKRGSRGEGRFDLDHTLPGIQQMADTTDWNILGIPLKVMAVQDPGDRHRQMLSAAAVAEAESGQQIMDLVDQVAPPGTQVITDRGTPYMSQADTMTGHEQEHAPCKEYAPTEKATLERGFGLVKQALAPLVEFFEKLAEDFPGLRKGSIATKLASLLLGVFLDVYRLAVRHSSHPLDGSDPDILRCIAEEQREKAREGLSSKLSTLERIHAQYAMTIGKQKFIRTYRSYALEDIVSTERKMRWRACNGGIDCPHQYFAAIINGVAEVGRERRRRERLRKKKEAQERLEQRKQQERLAYLHAHPLALLHDALAWAAAQWRKDHWLFDTLVCGQSKIQCAVETMAADDPLGFEDDVRLECRRWHETWNKAKPPFDALLSLVDPIIEREKALFVVS
jgi:hypothetical protein